MCRIVKFLLIVTAFMVPASTIQAADANERAIKARKGLMQAIVHQMGGLGAMAKGKMDYDAEQAKVWAGNLDLLARVNQGSMWPQGSGNDAYPGKTRALPDIWSTYPKVAEKNAAFAKAAANLAQTAGNGLEALQMGMGAVGKSCGGCHKPFRAAKKK